VGYRQTLTDGGGAYELRGLAPGRCKISFRADEKGNAQRTVEGRAGETVRCDVELTRGLVLEGVVRDEAGKPLDRVMVSAMGPFVKGRSSWYRHATTNKEGQFELVDCPTGPILDLDLSKSGYDNLHRLKVDARSGPLHLRMRFLGKPDARMVGAVVDADGKPVASAMISTHRAGEGNSGVHTTSKAGRIVIERLTPGTYTVSVDFDTYPTWRSPEHDLLTGETWDLGTVRLVRGGRARLTLDEPPVEGRRAYFSIYRTDGRYAARFDMTKQPPVSPPLAAGRYELRVGGPQVVPGTTAFVIHQGVDTEVRASAAYGVPVQIELGLPAGTDDVRSTQLTVTGADAFRFVRQLSRWRPTPFRHELGLRPGKYTGVATSASGLRGSASFDVTAGTESSIQIRITLR